jgi:bifunctional DNase/RNase
MNKIDLEISDIAPSGSTSGAYALVLSETNGTRKLPIVIGGHEAQAIAIELEKMTPSRPLTHDLFKSFAHAFAIEVEEIIIYNLIEGIFFAKVVANQDGKRVEIDSRTSDAVAIAVRFNCPIFCYDFILDTAGLTAEEAESEIETDLDDLDEESTEAVESTTSMSIADLERELNQAIANEDYERASVLRDEIDKRRSDKS